ncbi:bZIP transcription factor [Xylariomycetidae sp. FL2044]|nr:bZIP transcription factor [Xylariomycetidae sp. FL2044]
MQAYYRPNHSLTIDTTQAQKYFDEEDSSILDDSILEHSTIDSGLSVSVSPPMVDSRRDSFAVSGSLFSPKTEDWQSVDMQSVPSNNPFLEPQQHHSNNPFTRVDQSQATYSSHSHQHWSMGQGSGTCTPLQYDGLEATYDNGASLFQRPSMPVQTTPFSNPGHQVPLFPTVGSNGPSMPTSPQKDWMAQDLKQSMAKRMRPNSPPIRSHNELRRGDGIRKKNARFDIPAERNLSNIDQLIAQSTDDQEIKELKQQKRLLRNRQAALDSRQRKKQHTERLEDEKKAYTAAISHYEDEIADLNMQMSQLLREKELFQNHIEEMRMQKEEMIQAHTIETGDLRKKVSVLTDHVQRLEAVTMPSNVGYSNDFNDMDGMGMDPVWDNMGFMGDYPVESEVKQELQMVPVKKPEMAPPTPPTDIEKPAMQGGLVFWLFLFGAFVLSKRSATNMPRVPEDMREASATLLNDIFQDAGVAHASETSMAPPVPSQPVDTTNTWAGTASAPMASNGLDSVAPSMLGDMADSLTQPTQEQMNEQLFSLTPAQYNAVNSQDFMRHPPARSTSKGRRNLAEALANMRSEKQSAAEVYTRSLLWDQIPRDVVRTFAKMVSTTSSSSSLSGSTTF